MQGRSDSKSCVFPTVPGTLEAAFHLSPKIRNPRGLNSFLQTPSLSRSNAPSSLREKQCAANVRLRNRFQIRYFTRPSPLRAKRGKAPLPRERQRPRVKKQKTRRVGSRPQARPRPSALPVPLAAAPARRSPGGPAAQPARAHGPARHRAPDLRLPAPRPSAPSRAGSSLKTTPRPRQPGPPRPPADPRPASRAPGPSSCQPAPSRRATFSRDAGLCTARERASDRTVLK